MSNNRTWRGCVFIAMSLDGFIAKPGGDLAWLTDPAPGAHTGSNTDHPALEWESFFPSVDVVVMGRHTYETVAGFDEWPFTGKPVIVLSATAPSDPRIQLARGLEEAAALLGGFGAQRAYIDGGQTIQSFLAAGLIDEITVSIAPILLGRGHRLFGELDAEVHLTLRGHHATASDGLVRVTYDVETRKDPASSPEIPRLG